MAMETTVICDSCGVRAGLLYPASGFLPLPGGWSSISVTVYTGDVYLANRVGNNILCLDCRTAINARPMKVAGLPFQV
jgi:hypothetical protein